MTTHFITTEVSFQENPFFLQKEIEAELKKKGEPLRWAIMKVNIDKQTVYVEGIITSSNK
ncbi:MAG: hypothetical protein ACQJCO_05105 [cyanobacterium endosymbiont of Rhopalodia sterrenbergii]